MKSDPALTPLTKINLKYIKDLNIRPETSLVMFDNRAKNTQWGKYSPFTPLTKINSTWIKDLNVSAETTELLENLVKKLLDIGFSTDCLYVTSKAEATEAKTNKWL